MLLKLKDIVKSYSISNHNKQVVLNGVNLEVDHGEMLSVVGPSGVGKSTLLNIIGGLDKPDAGEVVFENQAVLQFNDQELAGYRNSDIGFIFQVHHLLPQLNAVENVLLPTLVHSGNKKDQLGKAETLLEKVGLQPHMHKYPSQLSVGECQRVAVARSLINEPKLILADEPTGSLDEKTASEMIDLLLQLNNDKKIALIVVTHDNIWASRIKKSYIVKQGILHEQD